ncbi:MAG: ATP-binding protein [Bacillota bacterium]
MRLGIRWKLAATYFLLIILILAGTNLLLLHTLEQDYLGRRQATALANANIIAASGGPDLLRGDRNAFYLARRFGEQAGARVLVVDRTGRVLVDSFGESRLEGKALRHDEVQAALAGKNAAGAHVLADGERVLYAAVPVAVDGAPGGAVMVVTALDDVYAALAQVRTRLFLVSLAAGLLAGLLAVALAGLLTRPVAELKRAVQRMARGHLDARVPVRGGDELGDLAAAFNAMGAELARVDRMRREFLANASHELKSPLSSIKALAQSLVDGREEDVEVYREFLRDIDGEIDRLGRLVNDLLTIARLEGEERPPENRVEDVGRIVEQVVALHRARAAQNGVILRSEVREGTEWPVNRDLLTLVLVNLLDNALRYTPAGGEVTVRAQAGKDGLEITVRDTGVGIPEEELPYIFERFYRVDRARARETGGTGLGLAIVRQAVRRMGGRVTVESKTGAGTVFKILLPACPRAAGGDRGQTWRYREGSG